LISLIISSVVRKGYKSPPPASSHSKPTSRDSFFMCTNVT